MPQQPPIVDRTSGTWFYRNKKWFIPVLCVGSLAILIGFVALLLLAIFGFMKSSDAYKGALARAKASVAVVEALGTPIRDGILINGSIHLNGSSGDADLAIPISGPKGKATIYVNARKRLGQWTFPRLIVEIKSTGKRVDISDNETLPEDSGKRTSEPL